MSRGNLGHYVKLGTVLISPEIATTWEGFLRCAMMAVQRFVQLAQADAAPSSMLFPASNNHRSVFRVHSMEFAGAIGSAISA